MTQRQSQWPSQSQRQWSSNQRLSFPGPSTNLQIIWGTLLPNKYLPPEGEQEEEDNWSEEEEEEPQFLDADEMSGGGMVLESAHCRRCVVTIDDPICNQKFDVTGRFPLQGPWWDVRMYVKRVGLVYYMKGYPSYFLRTEFTGTRRRVLSLFLTECKVPDEFVTKFMNWLSQDFLLTFHNLEEVLQQFAVAMDPDGGGYNVLTYVQKSCTGVNVKNALQFPLIMEYLPILLPRLFKNLLSMEKRKRKDDYNEPNEAEKDGLCSKNELLSNIEEMLKNNPWKLGFSQITFRELNLVHCEASLKAFQKCDALLSMIPELQMNALAVYNHMKQKCQETGDTYVDQDMLTKALSQDMFVIQAWEALAFLKKEEIVVCEKHRIFLSNLYQYEKDISCCIEKLMHTNRWCMNVDVEQVLRTEQAKLVKQTVIEDTTEKFSTLLPETESREPVFCTIDSQNNTVLQDLGHEHRPERPADMEVDEDQVQAAGMICSNPLTIISGKGGCGKTTVVSLLFRHVLSQEHEEVEKACKAFEEDMDMSIEWSTQSSQHPAENKSPAGMRVLLTAPTGKAASILKKKTNLPSFTLHQITASYYHWYKSTKEKSPDKKWKFSTVEALVVDEGRSPDKSWKFSTVEALVVDEGSLVSVQILSSVLKLLCKHAKLSKLIILGDVRQLPSIEPGNMLADVFRSAKDINWAIELRTNHRAESQLIVDNATRISEQKFCEFDAVVKICSSSDIVMPSCEKKFILVSLPTDGNDDDLQTAVRILLKSGQGLQDDKTSQFIAFRRSDCDLINELCCLHYSRHHTRGHKNKVEFQCQDKVCCTKNAYIKDLIPRPKNETEACDPPSHNPESAFPFGDEKDLEKSEFKEERLCNGEIFFIIDDVETDGIRCLTLSDMGERVYTLDYRKLRRKCGIKHAWARTIHTFQGSEEGTIVYVVGTAGRQNWQHVYTAVTRGRQRVYIITMEDQLNKAVFNKCRPRKTRLRQRLREAFSQRNDCAAATSSPPLGPSQENCAPSTLIILNQEKDIPKFPTSSNQNYSLQMNSIVLQDEMTDSDFEATCLFPERMLLDHVMQVDPNPSILKDTAQEKRDFQATFCSQQKPENFNETIQVLPDSGFPSVSGAGDSNTGYSGDMHVLSNLSGSDSFLDMNSSDIESLFRSPLGEDPINGDNMMATPDRKRRASGEEIAESPSKTARGILDDSPLGSAKFKNLSLTNTCQKRLFHQH